MARVLEFTLNGRPRASTRCPTTFCCWIICAKSAGLTGTKTGCDGGECGACTVLVDDKPRLSCLTLAATVAGQRVDTVESLGTDGRLSAVQRGFHEKLGSQCGYCTPGFIMASAGLLRRNPQPERGRHPRSARQQHLPLHRLREDHRGGAVRRRRCTREGARRDRMSATFAAAVRSLPAKRERGTRHRCAHHADAFAHAMPAIALPAPPRAKSCGRGACAMNEHSP